MTRKKPNRDSDASFRRKFHAAFEKFKKDKGMATKDYWRAFRRGAVGV